MAYETIKKLFICIKVTYELDRMFEEKRDLYLTYIQREDSDCLKIATIDGSRYLGKVVDSGLPAEAVAGISRHVRNAVAKFCPHMRTSDKVVKIFIQEYIG